MSCKIRAKTYSFHVTFFLDTLHLSLCFFFSEVTKLLQFIAQASHELIPPDVLEPVLKTLANNFITERNSADVMAIGYVDIYFNNYLLHMLSLIFIYNVATIHL